MKTHRTAEPLTIVTKVGLVSVVTIKVSCLTDDPRAATVTQEIRALSLEAKARNILLDFHCVDHVSITFLEQVRGLAREIECHGGMLRCSAVKRDVYSVLQLLGLEDLYIGHSVLHAVVRYVACLQQQNDMSAGSPTSKCG